MLLGIMHAAPSLRKPPLISSYQQQTIWPKMSVAYFTKSFQSIFTAGGWRMYPFNLPLSAPAYKHSHLAYNVISAYLIVW